MSIVSTMTSRPAASRRRTRGADVVGQPGQPIASAAINELARYIPTEAVALYVAILPFAVPKDVALAQQDFTTRWVLAVGVALAAVLFSVGVYRRDRLDRGECFRWPLRRTLTVVVAYAAWVVAIPGSPLNNLDWYTPSLGAVIGIVATATITLFHLWFGPPEE